MRRINFYKKVIQRIKSAVKACRIPKSFSKKKNNVFSNEQHIIMQVVMQLEKKRVRDMPAFLMLLYYELKLPRIPHFTTINKFRMRIKQSWLETMIAKLVRNHEATLVAIDGTGFSLNNRSPYFCTIAGERKQFMQCVAAADVKKRLFTAVRLRRKKRNENIDVPYLMKQSSKQLQITAFLGDRGFDSEKNHEQAIKLKTKFIAPLRKHTDKFHRIRGANRKKLARKFPSETYHQRSIIEGLFSAIKRRFGYQVYAKKFKAQKNELLFRIIAYNTEVIVNNSHGIIYFLQDLFSNIRNSCFFLETNNVIYERFYFLLVANKD